MNERVVITLDDFEHRLMIGGLNSFRNGLIQDDKPTDDIDDLILNSTGFIIGYVIYLLVKKIKARV